MHFLLLPALTMILGTSKAKLSFKLLQMHGWQTRIDLPSKSGQDYAALRS